MRTEVGKEKELIFVKNTACVFITTIKKNLNSLESTAS